MSKEDKKDKKGLFGKLWKKKKLNKPNKVAVMYLRRNGNAEAIELETTKDGFFNVNGKTYHDDRDCIYTITKERLPLAIIPEWSVTPIGRREWEDKPMQEKFQTLQDHVMKGIRHAERVRMGEKEGGKINLKTAIVLGIILIVVVAVIVGYV